MGDPRPNPSSTLPLRKKLEAARLAASIPIRATRQIATRSRHKRRLQQTLWASSSMLSQDLRVNLRHRFSTKTSTEVSTETTTKLSATFFLTESIFKYLYKLYLKYTKQLKLK